jgi:hypothetical protein
MVSNDYGENWQTMANPLPYSLSTNDSSGKSPTFFAGDDGRTVYYLNVTVMPDDPDRKIQFIAFKVY